MYDYVIIAYKLSPVPEPLDKFVTAEAYLSDLLSTASSSDAHVMHMVCLVMHMVCLSVRQSVRPKSAACKGESLPSNFKQRVPLPVH